MGSLGAVDFTFSVTPQGTLTVGGESERLCTDDVSYSAYCGNHGYKLCIVTSHKCYRFGEKKLILLIVVGLASIPDITLWDYALQILKLDVIPLVVWLGDNAFQGCIDTVTPYQSWHHCVMNQLQIQNTLHFNHKHSGRRIDVENMIGEIKEWAFVRGRTDIRLFDTKEKFEECINCIWSLVNYRNIGCPQTI